MNRKAKEIYKAEQVNSEGIVKYVEYFKDYDNASWHLEKMIKEFENTVSVLNEDEMPENRGSYMTENSYEYKTWIHYHEPLSKKTSVNKQTQEIVNWNYEEFRIKKEELL